MGCSSKCCSMSPRRINTLVTATSGLLFWSSWWIMIGLHTTTKPLLDDCAYYYAPSVTATVAFFAIATMPLEATNTGTYSQHYVICCRLYLFLSFFVLFSAMIGATYIAVNDFVLKHKATSSDRWSGAELLVHNLLIFIATFLFKFAKVTEEFY